MSPWSRPSTVTPVMVTSELPFTVTTEYRYGRPLLLSW